MKISPLCFCAAQLDLLVAIASLVFARSTFADEIPHLWLADTPVPKTAGLKSVDGVTFHVIKKFEPEADSCNWFHGVAIAFHRGRLYAFQGHNKGAENTSAEEARGAFGSGGGTTWSAPFTIDAGNTELAINHGTLLSHDDRLHAFIPSSRRA